MAAIMSRATTAPKGLARVAGPAPLAPRARRSTVRVASESSDAVKALEQYAAGARSNLATKDPNNDTVEVTPLAARGLEGSTSGSMEGGLLQLDTDTFWQYLEAQGNALVVVDFYTDYCGPCKLIYPELVKLSQARSDVRFAKVNCNKSNKELGMQLGIRVAPTFHLYRNKTKVADMTGAKIDKLIALIDQHQPAN